MRTNRTSTQLFSVTPSVADKTSRWCRIKMQMRQAVLFLAAPSENAQGTIASVDVSYFYMDNTIWCRGRVRHGWFLQCI